MSTDSLTLRDELAMRAPVDLQLAARICGYTDEVAWTDQVTLQTILVINAMARYQWADVMLAQREEPARQPGEPLPTDPNDDRRLDRTILSLQWFTGNRAHVITWLSRAGIVTLRQLLALSIYELEAIRGIGGDGLLDILDRLNREGLSLAPHRERPPEADPPPVVGDEAIGT